ncbi:MAG: MoaD/ThiS family protein, partial [Chromatiaceae bacterium]
LGYRRQEPEQGEKRVRLLYFSWLARKMRKESEQLVPPASVADSLLKWLGGRKKGAAVLFVPGRFRVTVNKQFTEGFTKLHDGDEIGLVPSSTKAPATPDLV